MAASFFASMTAIAVEIDKQDIVIGFDGRAIGGMASPIRDDAVKAAPINDLWALSFMGDSGFLYLLAHELWRGQFTQTPSRILERAHKAGRSGYRMDLQGDIAIDEIDRLVQQHKAGMLRHSPHNCFILTGHAESGPVIVTWAGVDQYKMQPVEEAYGRTHVIATPWGVGPCSELVLSQGSFEKRFGDVLTTFSQMSNGLINENAGFIRHSMRWELEGRS